MAKGLERALSAYLDTQIVVWLYGGKPQKLTAEAKRQIERNDLLISPLVLLELQYLFDRKRIAVDPWTIFNFLHTTIGLDLCQLPFSTVIRESLDIAWTSEPFDRIIVAQAKANGESLLITADEAILENYHRAVW
jgi:PIN domain nuclease of toxin-antitoxin system